MQMVLSEEQEANILPEGCQANCHTLSLCPFSNYIKFIFNQKWWELKLLIFPGLCICICFRFYSESVTLVYCSN